MDDDGKQLIGLAIAVTLIILIEVKTILAGTAKGGFKKNGKDNDEGSKGNKQNTTNIAI